MKSSPGVCVWKRLTPGLLSGRGRSAEEYVRASADHADVMSQHPPHLLLSSLWRFAQIVEDDMGPEAGKLVRRAATTDRLPEMVGQPGSARADAPKASPGTNAKVLLPALTQLASGLGTQHDLVKELLAAVQVGPLLVLAFAKRPAYAFNCAVQCPGPMVPLLQL